MSSLSRTCALISLASTVALASPAAWATTYRTIVVDGDLSDWDVATEKRPDDPLTDSRFSPGMDELSRLFVTWDATNLYVAYDFVAADAVIYYIQGPGTGAANFCNVSDFKAGVTTSEPMDVMIGHFDTGTVFGYKLANGDSTLEPTIIAARTPNPVSGMPGAVEAAIPWATLFGAGTTTVPANATIKIAGVVRGHNDGDFLGDVNPGDAAAASGDVCGGPNPVAQLTQYHVIHIDNDGDGTPDRQWNPGSDTTAGPLPDGGVGVDMGTPGQDMVGFPDRNVSDATSPGSDAAPANDVALGGTDAVRVDAPGVDGAHLDATPAHDLGPASDRHVLTSPDGAVNPEMPSSGGCGCDLGGRPASLSYGALLLMALLCAGSLAASRRR